MLPERKPINIDPGPVGGTEYDYGVSHGESSRGYSSNPDLIPNQKCKFFLSLYFAPCGSTKFKYLANFCLTGIGCQQAHFVLQG